MTFSSRRPYAMSGASRDVVGRPRCHSLCVLSEEKKGPLMAETNTETFPPHTAVRRPVGTPVPFCFHINIPHFQTDGKPLSKWLIMNGNLFFCFLSSYICTIEQKQRVCLFRANFEQNVLSSCHPRRLRCSFFAWKDRVTLSLPSISAYLGV